MLPPLFQHSTRTQSKRTSAQAWISEQPTEIVPLLAADSPPPESEDPIEPSATPSAATDRKTRARRLVALLLCGALGVALYMTWSNSGITQPAAGSQSLDLSSTQTPGNIASGSGSVGSGSQSQPDATGTILVYVTGAVAHPGVYTLPADARVYQLLQAAGGTTPNANLALINMAARLSDGQEVYVVKVGETPPTSTTGGSTGSSSSTSPSGGAQVNINTASAAELVQALHISRTTANRILSYRQLHGNYSSVDQLLQVVSASIYRKIKDLVTV